MHDVTCAGNTSRGGLLLLEVTLFEPAVFGALSLSNRVVMAPLTRTRAGDDGVPTDTMVEYYRQRAGQGLIITEGTWPAVEGTSYPGQPGIVTPEQIEGWRRIADAVHDAGGTIVMQLMHGGRVGHPAISGEPRVVGPSALAAPGETRTPEGKAALPVAHALTLEEIPEVGDAFSAFTMRSTAGHPEDMQVVYGVGGERWLDVHELPLRGWRGAGPVRIGNDAIHQVQRDEPGEILQQCRDRHGRGYRFDEDLLPLVWVLEEEQLYSAK